MVSLCLITLSGEVVCADEPTFDFDIPEQRADDALILLGEQADATVLFQYDMATQHDANRLLGEFTLPEAVDILLADSGLKAEFGEQGHLYISVEETQREGDDMNATKKAGLLATLAAIFTGANAQEPADETEKKELAEPELEEIIVVGTQIRGAGAAGANVITIDRETIEMSGLATTHEILQRVPQNFGGGNNEDVSNANISGANNANFASSANLRGLGTESTLSLINGRRAASGGDTGAFVDLNFIPTAAIERIEVLPDGASALYGSDAIAGVINVVLRDDYDGAETTLRYAPGTSDFNEIRFSQVFGKSWGTGNAVFTYEYYDREPLKSEDRAYTKDSDLTPLGGSDSSTTASNPANILRYTAADGTRVNVSLAIPAGQDGTSLTPEDLVADSPNFQNTREGTYVLPQQKRHTAMLLASQELSNTVEVFTELRFSRREFQNHIQQRFSNTVAVPSSNPFFVDLDPLGGSTDLLLNYQWAEDFGPRRIHGDVESRGATLGATFSPSGSWMLEAYGSYSTEDSYRRLDRIPNTALLAQALADPDPNTAFNPFGDGSFTNPSTLAAIEGFDDTELNSELAMINVLADGELFDLPGGTAKMAIGGQFHDQSLDSARTLFTSTPEPILSGSAASTFTLKRDVTAAFAEFYLPFVTERNSRTGIDRLIVSIAGRYDDYSDFGDTFNPKFGASWSPVDGLTVRGTTGTSFRAPLLTELDDSQPVVAAFPAFPDPASSTGTSAVIALFGNSASLVPEEGSTWTAGLDIDPSSLPGLSIGLTYFSTEIDNLIARPTNSSTQPLLEPENFAAIIARVPEDAGFDMVASLLATPGCFGCSNFMPDEIDVVLDLRLSNLTRSEMSGLDFDFNYSVDTDRGSVNLSLYGTYLFEFKEQAFVNAVLEDKLDTLSNPNSIKLRGGITWIHGGWRTAIYGNHVGDYISERGSVFDPTSCAGSELGYCRVSSWTTWDLNILYDFGERYTGFLGGTRLSLNVQNIFDTDPPFVDLSGIGVGYDPTNANPYGRFSAIQLTKAW